MSFSSSSGSSIGSALDGSDNTSEQNPEILDAKETEVVEDVSTSWESGAFGVLYMVFVKDNTGSWAYTMTRLFFDWIQMFLIVVDPRWGWVIDTNNKWWLTFSFLRLQHTASVRGYTFLLFCVYIWIAALTTLLAACIWAAAGLKHNSFEHTWLFGVIRNFRRYFLQVLDMAGMTLLLLPLDCQYFGVPDDQKGYMASLPDVYCFRMPHIIHMGTCAIALFLNFLLAGGFNMADCQLNPIGQATLAMVHTRTCITGFTVKFIMLLAATFLTVVQWKAVFLFIGGMLLCYLYCWWIPHQFDWVNYMRVGAYFSVGWASFMLLFIAYHPGQKYDDSPETYQQRLAITKIMWAGVFPAWGVGGVLAWKRKQFMVDHVFAKFKDAPEDAKARYLYNFTDPREMEVASRCCRVWLDEDTLDDTNVPVAERMLRCGVQLLPRSPYAKLLLSGYLMDVIGSYQTGYNVLKEARRMPGLSMWDRYMIFLREQEHTLKSMAVGSNGGEGNNNVADLETYLEYQRNIKLTISAHRHALLAHRQFWQVLLHRTVSFKKLADAVQNIQSATVAAERMYKLAISRHNSSLDLLSLYVQFLQGVKHDPWAAARWNAEVEKMQRQEEESNQRILMMQETNSASHSGHMTKAVIVMGANCIIRMANEVAASILGYSNRNDLVGKNVNVIVPPPFSRNHNSYVRNYIETGNAKVLGYEREFVALHRNGYVVPIKVLISKISGIGEDTMFMAVFEPILPEPDVACMWIMNTGTVLSCDQAFTDWFGYRHDDIHASPASMLMQEPSRMEILLAEARKQMGEAAEQSGTTTRKHEALGIPKAKKPLSWHYRGHIRHQFLEGHVPVDIDITVGGVGATALFLFKVTRHTSDTPRKLLVTNSKGAITHVSSDLAEKLGTTSQALQADGALHALDALLPLPFQRLHHQWCRNKSEVHNSWSCQAGLTMCLNGRSSEGSRWVPFKLNIRRKDTIREVMTIAEMEERTMDQMLDERRLSLIMDGRGIVQSASSSPTELFGLEPEGLVGSHLAYVIDVLQPKLPSDGHIEPSDLMAAEEKAAQMVIAMAEKSYEKDGMSWRVGVTPVMDPISMIELGVMAQAILSKKTIPAIMAVKPHLGAVTVSGARVTLPKEMLYEVELWRADLLSAVLEVDGHGLVIEAGIKGQPVFNPELLVGLPSPMIMGAHVSSLIPCGKSFVESLYTEGSMAAKVKGKAAGPAAVRGVLRAGPAGRRKDIGPVHTVRVQHGTDGTELELQVQAVAGRSLGPNTSSIFLIMHINQPRCGSPDFARMLAHQLDPFLPLVHSPGPASQAANSRRSSVDMHMSKAVVRTLGELPGPLDSLRASEQARARRHSVNVPAGPKATRFIDDGAAAPSWDGSGSINMQQPPKLKEPPPPSRFQQHDSFENPPESAAGDSDNGEDDVHGDSADDGASVATSTKREDEDDVEEEEHHQHREHEDDEYEIDGCGSTMAELKRGKRVKKLTQLLMTPMAMAPALRLRQWSVMTVAALVIVDIVMFVAFLQLLVVQRQQVSDLRSTSKAVNSVMQVAATTSGLEILLAGIGDPGLQHLGEGGTAEDIDYELQRLEVLVSTMDYYHRGVYRGFHGLRQLPNVYGLKEIWEQPVVPMYTYYKEPTGNEIVPVNMSLWDAGNTYILAARDILQNAQRYYGLATGNGSLFMNSTSALFILYNAPRGIISAYQETLDALMMKSVDDSQSLNNIQMIILAVEGALIGTLSVIAMWFAASKLVFRRFVVFSIFMMAPPGVVRTLASQSTHLGAGKEDNGEYNENDDNDNAQEQERNGHSSHHGGGGNSTRNDDSGVDQESGLASPLRFTTKNEAVSDGRRGCFKSLLMRFMFWRTGRNASGKRRLQESPTAVLSYIWPFALWMVLVIMLNSIGFKDLRNMGAPIAMSNLVQFVEVRVNRVLLLSLRYSSQQYFTPTFDGMAPVTVPPGTYNPNSATLHNLLSTDYPALRMEYDAMLYGGTAASVLNSSRAHDPHFALATQGIVFTQGADLLYTATDCLAEDPDDCYAPDEPFYRYTSNGIDQAMKQFFISVSSILLAEPGHIGLDDLDLQYVWEAGRGYLSGGLSKLADVYSGYVDNVYKRAMVLHIVALVLCISLSIIFLVFILRPAHAAVVAESRRVAQLLSQIPDEFDAKNLIASTLNVQRIGEDPQTQLEAMREARASVRAAMTSSTKKLRSLAF